MHKNKNKIRVLLADDHPVVREGIRSSLAACANIEIVGEAADGLAAVSQAKELAPDIVLMDINMPRMNGLEATELLRAEAPNAKVVVLTMHNHREYVLQIVSSGARGYVLKDASPEELVSAIEKVAAGDIFFSPDVAPFVLRDYVDLAGQSKPAGCPELTAREREVLALIAEDFSNKEISLQLGVSVRTIESHREAVMRKLNIHSVVGLTKYALAKGLIHLT